ncbi:MAG: SusC/RagA family TonB-linked outer membrane protein [Bacteroidota bacterium]
MKYFALIVMLFILSLQLHAQIPVTGKVMDGVSGELLPGTTVNVEGTTTGTITDVNGEFNLNVSSEADILVISFIGYKTQRIPVGTERDFSISLLMDVEELDEVVVTALGIKREKKALGYSVQDIDNEELTEGGNNNVVSALSGKIAGVQITTASGSVGGSAVIKIRGNKSFKGNTSPLFVIDGVPISNTTSTTDVDYGNAAADIDPESIETMSVLKGAAATALYGSRGANGVILITTKKGTKRKGIGVTFSSSVAFDEVYILPNYQNQYGQGGYGSEYEYAQSGSTDTYQDWAASKWSWSPDDTWDESFGARLDNGVKTVQFDSQLDADGNSIATEMISRPDNVKNFYETGISTVNSIALSGGGETAQGRVSITHTDQKGTTPNTDQQKLNIGFNSNVKLVDKLKFEVNGNYNITKNDNLSFQGRSTKNPLYEFNNWFGRQVNIDYLQDHYLDYVTHEDGHQSRLNWMTGYSDYNNNIYWSLYQNLNSRERRRLFGSISTTYTIADGFDLVARVGTDDINEGRMSNLHSDTKGSLYGMQQNPVNGSFAESFYRENETNADLMLNIAKNLTEHITINSTLGANYRRSMAESTFLGVPNLVVPDFYSTSAADGNIIGTKSRWEKETNSLFASANFGYRSYLFMDLTYRHDWSSTLPVESRSYGYPSATLGFIFSNAFDLQNNLFSYGKVRASYAQVGNDTSPYSIMPYYYNYGSLPWPNGSVGDANFFRLGSILPSTDLKPEKTSSYEFGGEFKFFQNRLGLDLTYYQATTTNQLMNVRLAPSSGYYTWKKNAGTIQNNGVEIQFYATPVERDNFSWDISVNYAKNSNKIIELDGEIKELELNGFSSAKGYGVSMWAREGQEWGILEGRVRETDENGNYIVEYIEVIDEVTGDVTSGDYQYVLTDDPVKVGSVNPDFIGGVRNTFNYKGFSLSALLDVRMGGNVYSATKVQGQRTGILQATVEDDQRINGYRLTGVFADGVIVGGEDVSGRESDIVVTPRTFWKYSRGYTEMGIIDGSFVKLREVNFSYRLPSSFVSKLHLQTATLSLFARNVALLYTHKSNDVGIDPEVAASGSVLDTGFENYNLPPARTIGAKIIINF